MSKRSPRLNGTSDEPAAAVAPNAAAAAETLSKLHFHPRLASRMSASIQRKQEALSIAAQQAIPTVSRTIKRMQACPDGIDPRLALQSAALLDAALIAMLKSLRLAGSVDRDSYNRLRHELESLQLRLSEVVKQIVRDRD